MQAIEIAIYTLLHDDSTIHGLVADKIYCEDMDEDAEYPSIVFFEVTDNKDMYVDVKKSRYQINLYSRSRTECSDLKDAVNGVLQRYKGIVGQSKIKGITYEGERNNKKDIGTGIYSRFMDYILTYY